MARPFARSSLSLQIWASRSSPYHAWLEAAKTPVPVWRLVAERGFYWPFIHLTIYTGLVLEGHLPDAIGRQERRIASEYMARCRAIPEPAQTKARELLRKHLTRRQWASLQRDGYFIVRKGWRRFKIDITGIVKLIDGAVHGAAPPPDDPLLGYCCHPVRPVPVADVMLAQLLLIKSDHRRFENTANVEPSIWYEVFTVLKRGFGMRLDCDGYWDWPVPRERALVAI